MNARVLLICCLIAAAASFGAKELWSVDGEAAIMQIIADGHGGCAFVRGNTNNAYTVVWVDKNGAIRFQAATTNISGGAILRCTTRELVYIRNTVPATLGQVDKKGAETVLSAPSGGLEAPILSMYQSFTADPKGFFAIGYYGPDSMRLMRFSNK